MHIQIPLSGYVVPHSTPVATASWSSCKGMLQGTALRYSSCWSSVPQCTLTATPTCSHHSGTALYETYAVGQRNPDVYYTSKKTFLLAIYIYI